MKRLVSAVVVIVLVALAVVIAQDGPPQNGTTKPPAPRVLSQLEEQEVVIAMQAIQIARQAVQIAQSELDRAQENAQRLAMKLCGEGGALNTKTMACEPPKKAGGGMP